MPVLYQAFTVIAGIFVHLGEYDAAFQMLDGIMPQILECEDSYLSAMAFSCLADGQVGLAGTNNSSTWRERCLNKALGFIDRGFLGRRTPLYFSNFSRMVLTGRNRILPHARRPWTKEHGQ